MDLTSEEKGAAFEKWVVDHLFPIEHFDLVERTHSYDIGKERYLESIKYPDFKFKCKKTGKFFWAEAKFRSHFNLDQKIEWAKPNTIIRYIQLNSTEIPVFIVIGYEGKPDNPSNVSFFHINELKYSALYISVLKKFNIPKESFTEDTILKRFPEITPPTAVQNIEPIKKLKNTIPWAILGVLLISLSIFLFYKSKHKYKQKEGQDKIYSYYTNLQLNKLNVSDYYSANILQYINKNNLTLNDLRNCIMESKQEFTNEQFQLNYNDILLNRIENEIRYYSFWLHYKCFRVSKRKTEECDVNVEIGIDNSNKFISYKEAKIENLKFY